MRSGAACPGRRTSCRVVIAGASRDVRHAETLRLYTGAAGAQRKGIVLDSKQRAIGNAGIQGLCAPGGAQVVAGVEDEAAAAHQPADLVHQLRGLVLLERACRQPSMHALRISKPCLRAIIHCIFRIAVAQFKPGWTKCHERWEVDAFALPCSLMRVCRLVFSARSCTGRHNAPVAFDLGPSMFSLKRYGKSTCTK